MSKILQFVKVLHNIRVNLGDYIVRFHVVLLFSQVLLMDSLDLLKPHFSKEMLGLFHHVLCSTYFFMMMFTTSSVQ